MIPTRRPRLSVIVPCLDEELNVPELARRVLETFDAGGVDGELLLVDDGSRDATWQRIEELASCHPHRVVGVRHEGNRGIAAAWKTGLAASRGELVAVMDADLQYQPEDLLRLHRELESHDVDIVQGYRSLAFRERGGRYWLSRGLNALLNTTFGMQLRDNKSGFFMCKRTVMRDLLGYEKRYRYWQTFVMVAARTKGYSIREVEALFESRRAGKSFLDGKAGRATARSLVDVAVAAREYGVRGTRPQRGAHWAAYMATFDRTHWLITRDVERRHDALVRSQWLSPKALRDLQDDKLRRLIAHAYENAPFYRERMQRARLKPSDVRTQDDLHKLPFLSKDDVREHLHRGLLSDGHDKSDMLRIATSGSTGEPLVCFADRAQLEFRWAATLRSLEWTGYRFGDRSVRLWHQTIGMSKVQVRKERLDAWMTRRRFIPAFEMSSERLEAMVREIAAWQPVLVDGYAEALDFLARYLDGGESRPIAWAPRAVMTSAQTLPDASRRAIEKAFACRVFDKYGAREFSGIAYECDAHAGHHVVGEGYIVEILRDGKPAKPGETGEVVITDLNNMCQPFIRYRIGDIAVAMHADHVCACGRGLPMIGAIEGRIQSIIVGTDGRYVPGTFFSHLMKEYDHAIRAFELVQEHDLLRLRIVRAGRFSQSALDEILAHCRATLGEGARIEVEITTELQLARTGKRTPTISHVPIDFQKSAPIRAVLP